MAQYANSGKFDESKIYANEIGEIICGKKKGRTSEEEFCYYKPVGMGVLDLAIAVRVYRKALELGKGTVLDI